MSWADALLSGLEGLVADFLDTILEECVPKRRASSRLNCRFLTLEGSSSKEQETTSKHALNLLKFTLECDFVYYTPFEIVFFSDSIMWPLYQMHTLTNCSSNLH